jgi:hypothetical protein
VPVAETIRYSAFIPTLSAWVKEFPDAMDARDV